MLYERGQCGIDDGHHLVLPGDLHDRLKVQTPQIGIGGRFREDDVRIGLDRLLNGLCRGVHERDLDAELSQQVRGEVARLAVAVTREDDVAVAAHEGHKRQDHGGHAAGEQYRALGALDGRKLMFAFGLGRVSVAAVLVLAQELALALRLHEVVDFLGVIEIVVRGMYDRRGDREVRVVHAVQAVDAEGGRIPVPGIGWFFRHSVLSSFSMRL